MPKVVAIASWRIQRSNASNESQMELFGSQTWTFWTLVASLLLVVMPGATSSFLLLVAMPWFLVALPLLLVEPLLLVVS